MSMRPIVKDSTDQSVVIRIIDSTDGTPETAVEHDTAGIDLWYRREGATKTSIVEAALASLDAAHADGGIEHIADGYYRLDLPDAAVATGVDGVMVGGTVTGMIVIGCYIPLIDALLTEAGIADAVLDETTAGHTGAGTVGLAMGTLYSTIVVRVAQCGDAGGNTTIDLDDGASAVNDFYKGQLIGIVLGTGAGQARTCVGYDGATKIATVVPDWATNPDGDSYFAILNTGSTVVIDWADGGRLDLILDTIAVDVAGLDGAAMRGTDGANTTVPDAAGTAAALHATTDGKIDAVQGDVTTIAGDVANIDGDAMRGTDGANTTVPDAAGTAAALHATTDGKIDAVQGDVTTIAGDVANIDGDAMRGTDGANTTVPDAAGTAAALHATTDGKVDAVQGDVTTIAADVANIDGDAMRGTDNAALASVVGALADAAADGDPTEADTAMQYIKQLINILIGTAGIAAFPAEAAPGNAVSLAEVIRAIHTDVTGLDGDAMRGTDGANTTVPDAAGTAAGLHATTDGKIDAVQSDVTTIAGDVENIDGIVPNSVVPDAAGTAAGLHATTDGKIDAVQGDVTTIAADVENIDGDAMRGTDGANTTVPDAAGTAAGLHATTDGKIDAMQADVTTIAGDVANIDGDAMRGTDGANTTVPDAAGTAAGLHATTDAAIAALNNLSSGDVQTVIETNKLDHLVAVAETDDPVDNSIMAKLAASDGDWSGFDEGTDSLEAIRDRGDTAWVTGGGASISDILNVQALIPNAIDLANTAVVRIALGLTNMVDDLPSTVEITPGTITIDRKAIGGTSWTNVVNAAACSEVAGLIYYDEVFDAGTGYLAGDSIRVTFQNQKITVAANDYEITGSDGWVFHTFIREAMRGTDGANTTVPDAAGTAAGLHATTDAAISAVQSDVTTIAADVENIDGDAMRGTDGANTTVPDAAGTAAALHATTDGKIDAVQGDVTVIAADVAGLDGDAMRGTDNAALEANVEGHVTTSLTTYDPPTKAEMDAAHALLATPAQVNEQVVDVLSVDTFAEPGQGAPAADDRHGWVCANPHL